MNLRVRQLKILGIGLLIYWIISLSLIFIHYDLIITLTYFALSCIANLGIAFYLSVLDLEMQSP